MLAGCGSPLCGIDGPLSLATEGPAPSAHPPARPPHYHKRSHVETALSMIKAKLGDVVRSRSDIGQLNEVLCHNICVIIQAIHELRIEPTVDVKPSSVINPIFYWK
jgi:hypothetical protein